MKADYHLDIISPENNPVSTCLTHVRGLKCEMRIDRDSKFVKVSGVGHRMWRKEYFPRVSTSLFKRLRIVGIIEAESDLVRQQSQLFDPV